MKCSLCNHEAEMLGGKANYGEIEIHLCHECSQDHDCYRKVMIGMSDGFRLINAVDALKEQT